MPSLTPLRFARRIRVSRSPKKIGNISIEPWYGQGEYHTNCGRFVIHKTYNGWYFTVTGKQYGLNDQITHTGLKDILFPTRTALVEALEQVCQEEGWL